MTTSYAPVAHAVQGARQTLRDIMSDYLKNKVDQSRHQLALAELDAQTRLADRQAVLEERKAAADLARAGMETRGLEARIGLESERVAQGRDRLAETVRRHKALEKHEAAQAKTAAGRLALDQEKLDYAKEQKSPDEWAETLGLTPTMREQFIGLFPEGAMPTRTDVDRIRNYIAKNPALFLGTALIERADVLNALAEQMKAQDLSAEDRAALQKQYDEMLPSFRRLKKVMDWVEAGKTRLSASDINDIRTWAREQWDLALTDAERAQYGGDFKAYEKEAVRDALAMLQDVRANLSGLTSPQGPDASGGKPRAPEGFDFKKDVPAAKKREVVELLNEAERRFGENWGLAGAEGGLHDNARTVKELLRSGQVDKAIAALERTLRTSKNTTPGRKPGGAPAGGGISQTARAAAEGYETAGARRGVGGDFAQPLSLSDLARKAAPKGHGSASVRALQEAGFYRKSKDDQKKRSGK